MEALLPSEVARLVLGYLEEENCIETAKCFLEASHHLNEYRMIAQKGKKYPTKVNGYSLKEVLEEYCLVHSIVQESLSSMTDQPNTGGSMIDSLRFLVRACQPVQVHINLHPQQGQVTPLLSKSDSVDSAPAPPRPRSKKTALQGQSIDNVDSMCNSQTQFFQNQPTNSTSDQRLAPLNSVNAHPTPQHSLQHLPQLMTGADTQGFQVNQNVNVNLQFGSSNQTGSDCHQDNGPTSHSEQHLHLEANNIQSQNLFQSANGGEGGYQESHPHVSTSQLSEQTLALKNSQQQLQLSTANPNEVMMQTGSEFMLESGQARTNLPKADESNCSITTKCFGSSIVILDGDNISQPFVSTGGTQSSNIQGGNDSKTPQSRSKILTPIKTQVDLEQLREKFMKNEVMVTKLAENINKVWTPAKQSDESQAIGEGSQDFDTFVEAVGSSFFKEPCLDQFLQDFLHSNTTEGVSSSEEIEEVIVNGAREKKRVVRRKPKKLKHSCENAVSDLGGETSTPSKQPLYYGVNIALPERTTPAKVSFDGEIMTPMTKLLKSITSPSGELYLDPTQFASLIDLPDSATKDKLQPFPIPEPLVQHVAVNEGACNKIIQVSQSNGTTVNVPVVYCNSNQQVAQYVNEKGVSTISTGEIQVMPHHGPYVPIVPKLYPGAILPAAAFGIPEIFPPSNASKPVKKKQQLKRCLTRGGRQSAGRTRADSEKPSSRVADSTIVSCQSAEQMQTDSQTLSTSMTDLTMGDQQLAGQKQVDSPKLLVSQTDSSNTVTLYAADGKEGSSTISYSSSSDLPILVSNSPEAVVAQPLDSSDGVSDLNKSFRNQDGAEKVTDLENKSSMPEDNEHRSNQEEENCVPPLNSSIVRNTPGLNGPSRCSDKRMSFSTPRRRLSHIRALDFNTPPKENDQSLRRANTSPKNMTSNVLSPHTTGKSIKSCARESLFKPPGDGSRRTSKVKAHLFKSPEYALASSSGFRVPSVAVTSTPAEATSCGVDNLEPSSAWDKIGGVSLILDSDVSPVKPTQPSVKKKEGRSWDSDLRLFLCDSDPQPLPSTQKRKASVPTEKRWVKKGKKGQQKDESSNSNSKEAPEKGNDGNTSLEKVSKEKNALEESHGKVATLEKNQGVKVLNESHDGTEVLNNSHNDKNAGDKSLDASNESDSEIARMIEHNLMNASLEVALPLQKEIPLKLLSGPTTARSKALNTEKDNVMHPVEENLVEVTPNETDPCSEELSCYVVPPKESSPEKLSKSSPQSHPLPIPGIDCTANSDLASKPESFVVEELGSRIGQVLKESTDKCQYLVSEEKVNTPVLDPSVSFAADKICLSKETWKESFSFDTPMKDNILANMIPQTPRFLDPSSQSKEDTPQTKLIKAVPIPLLSETCETPTPTVPPTPTIRNKTPSVSPSSATYFLSKKVSPGCRQVQQLRNSPNVKGDNLVNILIQECSRIEEDESMKKCRNTTSNSLQRSKQSVSSPGRKQNKMEGSSELSDSNKSNGSYESLSDIMEDVNKAKELSPSVPVEDLTEDVGCARLRSYKRKPHQSEMNKFISVAYLGPSKKQAALSSDETEICLINSPKNAPKVLRNHITSENITRCQEKVDTSSECDKSISSLIPSMSSSCVAVINIDGAEIEAALDQIHGKNVSVKKLPKTPSRPTQATEKLPPSPMVLTPSEQKQHVVKSDVSLAVSNLDKVTDDENSASPKMSSTTPVKTNICKEKPEPSASKLESNPSKNASLSGSDDDSSNSSSSGTSSDSDSSSSSSEEGTPIKENVSPSKQSSAMKIRNSNSFDKSPLKAVATVTPDQAETAKLTHPVQEEREKNEHLLERVGVLEQVPVEARTGDPNRELKLLIETKDMGTCEKIAKSRSFDTTGRSDIMIELQTKRLRTLEQLKKTVPGRHTAKDSKVVGPTETLNKTESPKPLPGVKGTTEIVDKEHTKVGDPRKQVPKKRWSENEKDVCKAELKSKPHGTSSLKASDEEEFKLHLSGDEKEEMSPEVSSEPFDLVEKQIAALHGDNSETGNMSLGGQSVVTVSENVIPPESTVPKARARCLKLNPKNRVSSDAADVILKTLLEKGFGCTMPPPPSERIKKLVPNTDKPEKTEKNVVNPVTRSKITQLPDERQGSPSSKNVSSRSMAKSSNGQTEELHLECDDEDEAVVEIINTSLPNSLEFNLTYKGLGTIMPRRDTSVAKSMKVTMFEGQPVCLAPTDLFTLWDKTPKGVKTIEIRSRKSVTSRVENSRTRNADSRSRTCGENRSRSVWVRNSGDRPSKSQDNRSRRNRSPSPRFRRDRHYSDDRGHIRDGHRSQDYHSNARSDSYSRRQEALASQDRRCSETESRSTVSSTLKPKPKAREDPEEGEITSSSDSDFETKPSSNRKRRVASPAYSRSVKRGGRERKTAADKNVKDSQQITNQSSPSKLKSSSGKVSQQVIRHRIVVTPSPLKQKPGSNNFTKENKSTLAPNDERISKTLFKEEESDVDLDNNANFPVLGDDANENGLIEPGRRSSQDDSQSEVVSRRRAPPRSVNAHKVAAAESKTPILKGKRKLSTSPDVASEESCQSSMSLLNPESKEVASSRPRKKTSLSSATKILKPDEGKDVPDSTDIIKNLDVELFLAKIHGLKKA